MSRDMWTSLIAGARAELVCVGHLSRERARDPAVGAMARIVALARTHITVRRIDHSIDADINVWPSASRDTTAAKLLGGIRAMCLRC